MAHTLLQHLLNSLGLELAVNCTVDQQGIARKCRFAGEPVLQPAGSLRPCWHHMPVAFDSSSCFEFFRSNKQLATGTTTGLRPQRRRFECGWRLVDPMTAATASWSTQVRPPVCVKLLSRPEHDGVLAQVCPFLSAFAGRPFGGPAVRSGAHAWLYCEATNGYCSGHAAAAAIALCRTYCNRRC